jgi:formate hydrogenlyase subunit 3/multisubunit Na+/H+ antiporter MnhD subunit
MAENKEEKKLALGKQNLLFLAGGVLAIILGFVLMYGPESGVEFNPDIYSVRRTAVGPMISFAGFIFVIFAILWKPKNEK